MYCLPARIACLHCCQCVAMTEHGAFLRRPTFSEIDATEDRGRVVGAVQGVSCGSSDELVQRRDLINGIK